MSALGPLLRRWWAARPPAWAAVGGPGSARGWEGWEAFDDGPLGGLSRAAVAQGPGAGGAGGRGGCLRLDGELRSGGKVGVAFCGVRFGEGTAAPAPDPQDLSGFWGLAVRCRLSGARFGGKAAAPPPLVVSLRTNCLTPAVAQGPQDLWQSFLACPPGGSWGVVRLPFEGFQRTWGGRLVEEESGAGMGTHRVAGLSFAMVLDGRDRAAAGRSPELGAGPAPEPAGSRGGHASSREPGEGLPGRGGGFAFEVGWVRAVREGVDPEACDEHGEPSPSGRAEAGRAA